MAKKKKAQTSNTIALNKKARHDYFIEEKFEAGVEMQGWEVKSCREGKAQLTDSYVIFKNGEAWLLGSNIQPLASASTHYVTEPDRTRRLLLTKRELSKLIAAVEQKATPWLPPRCIGKGIWSSAKSAWPRVRPCTINGKPRRNVTGTARSSA